jgi:hypothetical protein
MVSLEDSFKFSSSILNLRQLCLLSRPAKTIVMVGLYMWFRTAAEVLTLRKENVDLENRLITIWRLMRKPKRQGRYESIPA